MMSDRANRKVFKLVYFKVDYLGVYKMFVNREDEINALEDRWLSKRAEFIVVYGRRRVGKTELIEHFIKNKKGTRLLCRIESERDQLRRFSDNLSVFFNDAFIKINPFQNWDAFFSYLSTKAKEEKFNVLHFMNNLFRLIYGP